MRFQKSADHRGTQPVDVHRGFRSEVDDPPCPLGGASGVDAAHGGPFARVVPHHGMPAGGADVGHLEYPFAAVAFLLYRRDDLGDDVARLLHHDEVADADIPFRDKAVVVQRGAGNRTARQPHGCKLRRRGEDPGAPDLQGDIEQSGGLLFRRVLVRHRPLGSARSFAHRHPVGKPVDLDHRAVDIEGQGRAEFTQPPDVREHLFGIARHDAVGQDVEPELGEPVERFAVRLRRAV